MNSDTVMLVLRRSFMAVLILLPCSIFGAGELPLRLQYPTRSNDVILTGIESESLVFRPQGRDMGGRAYLDIAELERQQVVLHFILPPSFNEAIDAMEKGLLVQALPSLRQSALPLANYLAISHLPGNLGPSVLAYLDALTQAERWNDAVALASRFPLNKAPALALRRIGDLALALHEAEETSALERLHQSILASRNLSGDRLDALMSLAGEWRQRGEYLRAFDLYRKVQLVESPLQVEARLWVAYSSFYVGHDLVPEVFLEVLPDMDVDTPGFPLRELIRARLFIREGDYVQAMRSAAIGKTYANATDSYYPELLHTIGELYAHLDLPGPAAAAHQEVALLFSETNWARESRKVLENESLEAEGL